jgi:hypothetical protein
MGFRMRAVRALYNAEPYISYIYDAAGNVLKRKGAERGSELSIDTRGSIRQAVWYSPLRIGSANRQRVGGASYISNLLNSVDS